MFHRENVIQFRFLHGRVLLSRSSIQFLPSERRQYETLVHGSKSAKSRRAGLLLFAIPVAVVVVLVSFGFFSAAMTSSGTLVVEAEVSNGTSGGFISATATVAGIAATTPFNRALPPSIYTVTYSAIRWYDTPTAESVTVLGGKTAYSIGVYVPTPVYVLINQEGANITKVSAEHGVTPVIWINGGTSSVQLQCSLFSAVLPPGGNYTSVFSNRGAVSVKLLPGLGTVTVSIS